MEKPAFKSSQPIALRPGKINQDNIPFMLRELADRIEREEIPSIKTLFVVGVTEDNGGPFLEHYGLVGNFMEEVGALHMATQLHINPPDEGEDD